VDSYALVGSTVVTPGASRADLSLVIEGERLGDYGAAAKREIKVGKASFIYPALINSHDHLRGNYLPRVGPKGDSFYVNWLPWDNDLKSSGVYDERSGLSVETMYFLSSYKNLFSGVATVNDHFPHKFAEPFIDRLPIRVIREYCLAHECSSYDLKWGDGMELEHKWAVERDWPFITHLEEGFDAEAQAGVEILERAGCLTEHDLLIHCIGFSDEDIRKVKKAGASVSWCPASNMLMFNTTCKIRKLLHAGVNVALGTDSTHTGSVNTLEEMKYARKVYREYYGEELPASTIFEMVTKNAAMAFRIWDKTGSLEPGKLADVAVFKALHDDPYESLAQAGMEDLELLVVDGKPVYGLESVYGELVSKALGPSERKDYGRIKVAGRAMFVKGDPAGLYKGVRSTVGFKKKLDYLPFDV
jgi:5-methylthioadenosine/S-adenosylhomocysteine deaminase